jgi:hypothetical protein
MTLDVLIAHDAAREAVRVALQLPAPLAKLLLQYLALFRPGKRQLSWARVGAILGELREPIATAQLQRNGRSWPAPVEYWRAALEQMVQLRDQEKLRLPLKSNGYLFEVIVGMSDKVEAAAEAKREAARRGITGNAPAAYQPAPKLKAAAASLAPMPEGVRERFVKRKAGGEA